MKQASLPARPQLIKAEVVLAVTVFSGRAMPGDIVEVDETTFRNLERKGRLKLAAPVEEPKAKEPPNEMSDSSTSNEEPKPDIPPAPATRPRNRRAS